MTTWDLLDDRCLTVGSWTKDTEVLVRDGRFMIPEYDAAEKVIYQDVLAGMSNKTFRTKLKNIVAPFVWLISDGSYEFHLVIDASDNILASGDGLFLVDTGIDLLAGSIHVFRLTVTAGFAYVLYYNGHSISTGTIDSSTSGNDKIQFGNLNNLTEEILFECDWEA